MEYRTLLEENLQHIQNSLQGWDVSCRLVREGSEAAGEADTGTVQVEREVPGRASQKSTFCR